MASEIAFIIRCLASLRAPAGASIMNWGIGNLLVVGFSTFQREDDREARNCAPASKNTPRHRRLAILSLERADASPDAAPGAFNRVRARTLGSLARWALTNSRAKGVREYPPSAARNGIRSPAPPSP